MSAEDMALAESGNGLFVMAWQRLHSLCCGLNGHDLIMNIEPRRLSLQCTSCHHVTPGWTLKEQSRPAPSTARRLTLRALVEQSAQ